MINKLIYKLGYRPVHWTDETRGRLMEVFDYLARGVDHDCVHTEKHKFELKYGSNLFEVTLTVKKMK